MEPTSWATPRKGVGLVHQERRFGCHECLAGNFRDDLASFQTVRGRKNTPQDPLLTPAFARIQEAVGRETGDLGAGPRAARRTVVRAAGAEHKIPALVAGVARRPEELDMIDLGAVCAGDIILTKGDSNSQCDIAEAIGMGEIEGLPIIANQEKPIATPCNVAGHSADSVHVNRNVFGETIAGNVLERRRVRAVVLDRNPPDGALKKAAA